MSRWGRSVAFWRAEGAGCQNLDVFLTQILEVSRWRLADVTYTVTLKLGCTQDDSIAKRCGIAVLQCGGGCPPHLYLCGAHWHCLSGAQFPQRNYAPVVADIAPQTRGQRLDAPRRWKSWS